MKQQKNVQNTDICKILTRTQKKNVNCQWFFFTYKTKSELNTF